jgi:hypothetical protein
VSKLINHGPRDLPVNDYMVKTYGSGKNNSGATGRKAKARNLFNRNLIKLASAYTRVIWCSDSYRNR